MCLYFQAEIAKAYRKLARKYHPDRYKVCVKTWSIWIWVLHNKILCIYKSETWWDLISSQYINLNFFEIVTIIVSSFFYTYKWRFSTEFPIKSHPRDGTFFLISTEALAPPPSPYPPLSSQPKKDDLPLLSKYKIAIFFFSINTIFSVFESFGTIQQ